MSYLEDIIDLARANPRWAVAAFAAVVGLYLLARRKPRMMREAERDLERLRQSRSGQYDELRPLR
jgi:hypothetical protein